MNEAAARVEAAKEKARIKAERKAQKAREEQAISGETGVTPSHSDDERDEPGQDEEPDSALIRKPTNWWAKEKVADFGEKLLVM